MSPDGHLASAKHRARYGLAACVVLLYSPNLLALRHSHGLIACINTGVLPAALLLTLFAVLGQRLWAACLLALPFIVLAPVEAAYVGTYGRPSSPEVLATVFASNLTETREYLGTALLPLAAGVLAATLLGVLTIHWCRRSGLSWNGRTRTWILSITLATPVASILFASATAAGTILERVFQGIESVATWRDAMVNSYPFGIFQRVADYRRELAAMRDEERVLNSFRFRATRAEAAPRRHIYALVVGESSRRDHWHLFGYERPTNPELERLANLVLIPDLVSSWPISVLAIPMIVTRKPENESGLTWREPSILRAMEEAGFDTYWISNQTAIGRYDSPVSEFALEARHRTFLNHATWSAPGSYDEDLLAPLREAVASSSRDLFIVLHMMGSHTAYDYRYPASFARFIPTSGDTTSNTSAAEREKNSYDNSILYTDHVLASVIRILDEQHEISALWFEADHGEDLATENCAMTGHGNGTIFDFQVPAFVWYSDAYFANYPERIATLRENAAKRTTSSVTFESLIDLAGVTFPGHDRSMSLFSRSWHPRSRFVNAKGRLDFDQAKLSRSCAMLLPP